MTIHRDSIELDELKPNHLVLVFSSKQNEIEDKPLFGGIIRLIARTQQRNCWDIHERSLNGPKLPGTVNLSDAHSIYFITGDSDDLIGKK